MSKKDWITSLLLDRPPMFPKKSGFCCLKKSLATRKTHKELQKENHRGKDGLEYAVAVDELTLQGKETKLFCAKIYQLSI